MNDNHDQIEPSTQMAGSGADWKTHWTPSRRHFLTLTGLALGGAALGLGVSACGTAQTGSSAGQAKGRAGAAGETMFVAGFQWGPPPSFNPLAAVQPGWPTNWDQSQLIYESLMRFNLIDGSLSPGLAKELQQPDDQTFALPLQDGTKWSDGSELTADDVVFTFELGKTASVSVLHGLAVHRLGHGHRSAHCRVQAEVQAVQPHLREELHRLHLHRA